MMVLSSEAEARKRESGLHAMSLMPCLCPVNVLTSAPVSTSQMLTVSSALPDPKYFPSGLKGFVGGGAVCCQEKGHADKMMSKGQGRDGAGDSSKEQS